MAQAHYSILRVKRKRDTSSPLDALVINGQEKSFKKRKSSQSPRALFRFSETVPISHFKSPDSTREIHNRINLHILQPVAELPNGNQNLISASTKRSSAFRPPEVVCGKRKRTSLAPNSEPTRFRVVERQSEDKIKAATGAAPGVVIYDAIEDSTEIKANIIDADDETMNNFIPMLQEYLTLHHSTPSVPSIPVETHTTTPESDSEDFVYDIYYRDLRNISGEALGAININDLGKIGQLAGLDEDDLVEGDWSSDEEDMADEDSNDENDYRNDYPDSGEDHYSSEEDPDDFESSNESSDYREY